MVEYIAIITSFANIIAIHKVDQPQVPAISQDGVSFCCESGSLNFVQLNS